MLVGTRMTPNPITVSPDSSFEDALQLLREKKIRRLPVVDKQGNLVGIVVEKDLLYASPSPATSLSVFEVHYLLSKLQVKDVMTKRVIAVGEDCPLEEAARILVDHKIGSLPVLRDRRVVGIITETDIFRTMAEALGGRAKGLRIVLRIPEQKGELAKVASKIAECGGNIISLATFLSNDTAHRELTIKLQDGKKDDTLPALEKLGVQVLDVREITSEYQPTLISSR
ncbi:MAG: CBS and ACT domain-containing protein [Chloroflexi bacterium]|nr:CBS and ACT domain-containing protein [Chloroflexota bacterium]MCL5951306.1 CBS and ACT domain-containing protein [Chloroflexota bacterium]